MSSFGTSLTTAPADFQLVRAVGDGSTTTFPIPFVPGNYASVFVVVDGKVLSANGVDYFFTAQNNSGGCNIILASAPGPTVEVEIRQIGRTFNMLVPGSGTVGTNQLAYGAVTGDKIASHSVSVSNLSPNALNAVTGAPLYSPSFSGAPTAPTPTITDNSTLIATTAFVREVVATGGLGTTSYAPLDSPTFTGNPQAPVVTATDNSATLATTAFVQAAIGNGINGQTVMASPILTGTPTAPTPTSTDSSNQIATTAFVTNYVSTHGGGGGAPLNSPNFTGTPTAPTPSVTSNSSQLATTAFVQSIITPGSSVAPVSSPNFTGNPTAPTQATADSSTRIATTAFVHNVVNSGGGGGGAPLDSPNFTGNPTAPTITVTDSSTTLATTAFVHSLANPNSTSYSGTSIYFARSDHSHSGGGGSGAPLNSPNFTGTPTAPTVTVTDNSTTLATTAFVKAAINAGGLGGGGSAPLDSPAFTGNPTAPTPTVTDKSTSLATTQFVSNAIAAKFTQSFNNSSDWNLASDYYTITFPASSHSKGSTPAVQVYMFNGTMYQMLLTDSIGIYPNGDVVISVTSSIDNRFTGRVCIF